MSIEQRHSENFVDPDGDKYRAATRNERERAVPYDNTVGVFELRQLKNILAMPQAERTDRERRIDTDPEIRSLLSTLFSDLSRQRNSLVSGIRIDRMVEEAIADRTLPHESSDTFWKAFDAGTIPPSQLVELLRHRERRQDRLEAEWAPRFERWQQEFSEAVDRAIASGLLPPNPNYRQRVADVRFILLDPIVGGNRGGRVYDSGIISINVDRMDEEATKLTVFHELSHQISGTMIQQVVTEQGTPGSAHARRKTGLEFQSRHDGRKQGTWLNEALTELLARRLAGTEETSSYLHEQAVVLSLVEGGAVPMSLFYRAYCESPDTPANRRSGLPAYRELNRAMTKALGPGWLRRVDDFVKQQYEAERM